MSALDDAVGLLRERLGRDLVSLGVGGSSSRGGNDRFSDLDLFIVVDAELENAKALVKEAARGWGSVGEGKWVPGFGYQVVSVSAENGLLEIFVNNDRTLVPDRLWTNTEVLFDADGTMGGLVGKSEGVPGQPIEERFVLLALSAHSLRKKASRGHLFDCHRLLDDLRREIARIAVALDTGEEVDGKVVFRTPMWCAPGYEQAWLSVCRSATVHPRSVPQLAQF
jgi:hypothetical protein